MVTQSAILKRLTKWLEITPPIVNRQDSDAAEHLFFSNSRHVHLGVLKIRWRQIAHCQFWNYVYKSDRHSVYRAGGAHYLPTLYKKPSQPTYPIVGCWISAPDKLTGTVLELHKLDTISCRYPCLHHTTSTIHSAILRALSWTRRANGLPYSSWRLRYS